MRRMIMVLAMGCLFLLGVGCAPAGDADPEKGEISDCSVCAECAECQKCRCQMADMDFFGTYYSSCVQAVRDSKALLDDCGRGEVMPDVETCVWYWWNDGRRNGNGRKSGCTRRVGEVAWVRAQPVEEQCDYVCEPGEGVFCESCLRDVPFEEVEYP